MKGCGGLFFLLTCVLLLYLFIGVHASVSPVENNSDATWGTAHHGQTDLTMPATQVAKTSRSPSRAPYSTAAVEKTWGPNEEEQEQKTPRRALRRRYAASAGALMVARSVAEIIRVIGWMDPTIFLSLMLIPPLVEHFDLMRRRKRFERLLRSLGLSVGRGARKRHGGSQQ